MRRPVVRRPVVQRPVVRRPVVRSAGRAGEWSLARFLLALLAFSLLILSIFNLRAFLFGIPLLYVYLFLAWGGIIALLAMTARAAEAPGTEMDAAARRDRPSSEA